MIAPLTTYNPDRLLAVDRVDERANSLLLRAGIRPGPDGDTAAMVIFRWLLHMTGGKAGSVAGVTAATLAGVTQGKESAAREAIKLLDDKGLVCLAPIGSVERPNRRSPYVIHVLEQAVPPAQRTFEFAERPTAQPVLRVTHGGPDTSTDLCTKPFVQSFVQSPLHKAESCQNAPLPPKTDDTEVVAAAKVGSSSEAGIADDELPLARDSQRVRASNHQVHNKSNSYQLQVSQDVLSQETRARQAIEARESGRLSMPQTIGAAFAEAMLERKGVLCFEANEQGIAALEEQVMAIMPKQAGKYPCPSMPALRHICEAAVMGQDADGKPRYPPAKVLSCAAWVMSRKGVISPWALFFDRSGDQMAEVGLTRFKPKGGA